MTILNDPDPRNSTCSTWQLCTCRESHTPLTFVVELTFTVLVDLSHEFVQFLVGQSLAEGRQRVLEVVNRHHSVTVLVKYLPIESVLST